MLELTIALVVLDSICVAFDGDETDHTGCPKGNLYWSKVGKIKPDIPANFGASIMNCYYFL